MNSLILRGYGRFDRIITRGYGRGWLGLLRTEIIRLKTVVGKRILALTSRVPDRING